MLVAKNRENGRTPSLAISCLTLDTVSFCKVLKGGLSLVGLTPGGCEGHDDNVTQD